MKSINTASAIEKMYAVQNWVTLQNHSFNLKIQKFSDLEKLYDYCLSHDIKCCDEEYFKSNIENDLICFSCFKYYRAFRL